jgi:beta-xylosidase
MVSIARSRSIWGPFESYEQNPILSADGTDRYIQHTGHADLFQDADHEWWAVVLGVRNFEDQGRFPMGRESFLTHVKWPENGWPQIAAIEMDMERKDSKVLALENTLPKFEQPDCVDFVYIRDPDLENYTFSEDSKDITLASSITDLSSPSGTCSFVGKRQRAFDSTCMVELSISTETTTNIKAGLAVYKDDFKYAQIYLDSKTSHICFQVINKAENVSILEEAKSLSGRCVLKIRSTATAFEFSYREPGDGSPWQQLGSIDSKLMTGYDFTGTIFGIFATHGLEGKATAVEFKSFSLN